MNNLKLIDQNGSIKIYETDEGVKVVNGRELWEGLGVQKDFSDWIKNNLVAVDADEIDFSTLKGKSTGGRPTEEYILKLEIAKEICMVAGASPRANDELKKKSKEYRRYLISVEEKYKQINPYNNLSKELQAIFMVDKKQQELERGQEVLTDKVTNLENKMTINYELAENIRSEVSSKAISSLGGYNSAAYKKLSKKVYSAVHKDLKGYFKVNSYKNLSVKRYEDAINYIQGWTPGTNLRLEIEDINNQIQFNTLN